MLGTSWLAASSGHGDIGWSPEQRFAGASMFLAVAGLGVLASWTVFKLAALRSGAPPTERKALLAGAPPPLGVGGLLSRVRGGPSAGPPQAAQQALLGVAYFASALWLVLPGRVPALAVYPNLYSALRLVHAYASLPYAWVLFWLCLCDLFRVGRLETGRLRWLVLGLWTAWLLLYALLSVALVGTPYGAFWTTDCSDMNAMDAARLAASQGALARVAQELQDRPLASTGAAPWLCVAMPSRPRDQHYLTQSLGTLLGGLSREELAQIRVKVVSSTRLSDYAELAGLLGADGRRLRPLVDFVAAGAEPWDSPIMAESRDSAAALRACGGGTFQQVLFMEDDAVATAGVLRKLAAAVQEVDKSSGGKWQILKLMVSERVSGGWTCDRGWIVPLLVGPVLLGAALASAVSLLVKPASSRVVVFLCILAATSSAMSYTAWAVGRPNLQQLFPPGLSRHGPQEPLLCAMSVADVFPASTAEGLATHVLSTDRPFDFAACDFVFNAGEHHGRAEPDQAQWLYSPSLFQHVGRFSTKGHTGDSCGQLTSSMTWSAA